MKINQFRDPGLEEDYMDVHYREYNDEIRRILALTESGNTLWGKREGVQACLSPEEIYYFETVDRKCFACLKEEVYQVELGIQSAVERFGPLGFSAYQQISGGECLQGTSADGGYEYADAAAFG